MRAQCSGATNILHCVFIEGALICLSVFHRDTRKPTVALSAVGEYAGDAESHAHCVLDSHRLYPTVCLCFFSQLELLRSNGTEGTSMSLLPVMMGTYESGIKG